MVTFRDLAKITLRRCLPIKWYRQVAFRIKFGRWIDFENPKTLNETIMWRKTYGYKDIHTQISDKYCVRQYVADKVGERYLIPLYAVLYSEKEFVLSDLPDSFVAKPANSSGQLLIVRNKNKYSETFLRSVFRKWLKSRYFLCAIEPEYKYIEPKIVIEKLLLDEDGQIPTDYKFHCFGGRVEMIQVDLDRFGEHRRNFYSPEWNLLPFLWTAVDSRGMPRYRNGGNVEKPQFLQPMISVAEKLSHDFGYVRVDLYCCDGYVYFGELTLSHGGGFEVFMPDEYDNYYGSLVPRTM